MILSNEERETHLSMVADDRSIWHISSDDPVLQARLEKIGATLVRVGNGGTTHFYTLPSNQVRFIRERKLSDEQRARLSERMRKLRSLQETTS